MSNPKKAIANLSPEAKRKLLAELIQKKASNSQIPLSFAQQRLWFLDRLQPDSSVYNIPAALRLIGSLNIPALEASLNEIVRRHEILRTNFTVVKEAPVQRIATNLTLTVSTIDLQALPPNQKEVEIRENLEKETKRPFNLENDSLLRCTLLKLDRTEYVLLFAMHHIISDYWSMRVLIRELVETYQAFCLGKPSPLPELPIQYADFAVWQRKWLEKEASTQLAYWKQQLENSPSALQLPTDRPRPPVQTFRGATSSFSLSKNLSEALKALSRQEKVTLFMILLAAFKVLLYRYTGQEDILVGSTIANRNRPEIENLIGLLVNNLVFRTNLSENFSFLEFLKQVREVSLGAYAHQDLPFEYLVEKLQLERQLSHNPMFQVMFVLHNTPAANIKLSELTIAYLQPEIQTARFDLSLDMYETPEGLTGVFEYNTDLFDPATIVRMAAHFQILLSGVVSNPQQKLSELPLLTVRERQQLLREWNDTAKDYPNHLCIHQLFEAQVEKTPDAVAVVYQERPHPHPLSQAWERGADNGGARDVCSNGTGRFHLTYRELNAQANQLARHLRKLGIGTEELIGVCLERSHLMLVALFGILKAGGAYVPLDPAYPKERLAFTLEDAKVKRLLTTENLVSALPEYQGEVLCLDRHESKIYQESRDNLAPQAKPDNLAYVIYTSGSTGKPKGAQILHRAVVNFLTSMRETPGLTAEDILLSVTTLSFDIAALELYLPLIVGARLVVVSREIATDASQLLPQIDLHQVTTMQATPATWRMLIDAGWLGSNQLKILCGGEALTRQLANELRQRSHQVWNLYGPTETTIWSAAYHLEDSPSAPLPPCPPSGASYIRRVTPNYAPSPLLPISHPIANTQFYVLDRQQQLVPVGVPGELYIGGAGLARGYLNRPELTKERFIQWQGDSEQTITLYKTGDRVRYLADGNLQYLDRLDNQVKIRGFRLELNEIEAVLSQHPDIREAAVIVQEKGDDRCMVAYCVPQNGKSNLASLLRHFLEQKLPQYAVPSYFIPLEALPLTPSGKIDRRSLPAPEPTQLLPLNTFIAPRTPTEEIIAGIWAKVLNLKRVGINDNFFEIGGHSLLATRVISRLREVYGVELPLRSLFEHPTVSGLARQVQTAAEAELGLNAPPIQPISRSEALPLSFAQQRQWFLSQLEPDSPFYNIPAAVRIQGTLNVNILEQSFQELIHRHEILRTHFATVDGKPLQVISSTAKLCLQVINETSSSSEQEAIKQLAIAEAKQPFDLNSSPLLRVKVLRLNPQEFIILLTLHHIISDAWSIEVLVREVAILYQAFLKGNPSPLPELPIQYVDFAAWQRQWLQGEIRETQLNYWRHQLENAPAVLALPTDYPRPAVQTFQGASYSFSLSQEQYQGLKTLSQQSGTTLFMTLLATFNTLLYRYTGSEDIVVGSPIANRNRAELEGLIGFFANTLTLRTNLSGNPSFLEVLQQVKETALAAYTHQDLPFEQLVEELQPQRSLSHSPLFQVMFVLQAAMQPIELMDLNWSPIKTESNIAKFDLTLYITETAKEAIATLEYNSDLFKSETIQRMARHLQILLSGIIVNPQQRIAELPLITETERQQLLIEWNDTQRSYPDRCIYELFEAQVARNPDAVAIVFDEVQAGSAVRRRSTLENQTLTYRELNTKANQLAHYLQKSGVAPEVLVGICVERSPLMVIGMLGILKAGGAYVPLDPAYPQERLSFMLEDARVSVLLTQQELTKSKQVAPPPGFASREEDGRRLSAAPPSHGGVPWTIERSNDPSLTVFLDTDWEIIAREKDTNPISEIQPHNLAYVIYTSGSTGKPKGVAIAHQSTLTLIHWAREVYTSEQLKGVLASTSICFDLSVFELFVPLSWGGTVVLAENALQLPNLSMAKEVTLINTVPSAAAELLRTNGLPDSKLTINLAGEALSGHLVQQLYQHKNVQQVFNLYGPSEDTTYSTYALAKSNQTPPIGRPIANTQTYILDSYLQPVPVGVPGELYISSAGLARYYLNRPELTAAKFIPNPFGNSERFYKTGDLARYLSDGNIEYLGRLDNQVKIRGFRIELGEIEAVLTQHPDIAQAVVEAKEDRFNHKRLVAYIVPELDKVLNQDLRYFLKQKLPGYMVPSTFVMLKAFPLTPNGKIDRRSLPEAEIQPELTDIRVEPRTTEEKQLAQIWQAVLGIEQVGTRDNFFELGGDSILAIGVIAKANQMGLQLIPKHLFQHQTIAELATVAGTNSAIAAEQGIVTGIVPLTPIQHWFFAQNFVEPHHWNQSILLEVQQTLDFVLLEKALQKLLEHHDGLRLYFERTESGWQQINAEPNLEVPLVAIDLSTVAEIETAIATTATQLHSSLDLSSPPLIRIALFNLGAHQNSRLLIVIHHLVVDGISWRILLEDLQTTYRQLSQGKAVQLPPKTTSFKQWAERLQDYANSVVQQELDYWSRKNRPQPSPIPVDFPQGNNTMAEAKTVSVSLSTDETEILLHKVPAAYQTQINDVLIAALGKAFERWTNERNLLIELEGHGRENIFGNFDVTRTIGWFTTLFPVLLDLEKVSHLGNFIKSIKEQLWNIPQKGFGYSLFRYLGSKEVQKQLKNLPQAEIRFNYLGQSDQLFSSESLLIPTRQSSGAVRSPQNTRSCLIEIDGIVSNGELRLNWTYSKAIYHQSTIENLAQSYISTLRQIIAHCLSPEAGGYTPSDFPQMDFSQADLDKLLADYE